MHKNEAQLSNSTQQILQIFFAFKHQNFSSFLVQQFMFMFTQNTSDLIYSLLTCSLVNSMLFNLLLIWSQHLMTSTVINFLVSLLTLPGRIWFNQDHLFSVRPRIFAAFKQVFWPFKLAFAPKQKKLHTELPRWNDWIELFYHEHALWLLGLVLSFWWFCHVALPWNHT